MAFLAYSIVTFAAVITLCCVIVTVIDMAERRTVTGRKLMKMFSDDTNGDLR